MARYREKSPEDLAWNSIRTRITRELDTEIKIGREKVLNKLLGDAFREYLALVGEGELPEIESRYSDLARAVVVDVVDSDATAVA